MRLLQKEPIHDYVSQLQTSGHEVMNACLCAAFRPVEGEDVVLVADGLDDAGTTQSTATQTMFRGLCVLVTRQKTRCQPEMA